jgi:two-component system sensor histidine kinase KdpD
MSRLRTGTLPIELREVALDEIVLAAIHAVAGADSAGRVEVDVPDDLAAIRTDPVLLERAVANVLDNALLWSPAELPVRIDAAIMGGLAVIRVSDRGPGIPEEQRRQIFEPFHRLGDTGRRGVGAGVGLGLAVARGFVDALGGDLEVEDTPGGGALLVISVPTDGPS